MTRLSLTCSILLSVGGLLSPAAQEAVVQPQPVAIDGAVNRVYKSVNGAELRLHIFKPQSHDAANATPAIVFFFGGGWTGGTVDQFRPQSKHMAQRGMIAIVADYRVFWSSQDERIRSHR